MGTYRYWGSNHWRDVSNKKIPYTSHTWEHIFETFQVKPSFELFLFFFSVFPKITSQYFHDRYRYRESGACAFSNDACESKWRHFKTAHYLIRFVLWKLECIHRRLITLSTRLIIHFISQYKTKTPISIIISKLKPKFLTLSYAVTPGPWIKVIPLF